MGVYLSAPIVEKESFDEQCGGFTYGASSMQGWRVSQEDAHNCIPDFDKEAGTSFFAVYDGHGGAEVAKYTHLHFPDYVKSMMAKNMGGELENLIQTAFLQFDATLTEEDVIKKLKELAGKDDENEEEEDPDVPVGRTEADMLKAEADMPLEELLAKYKPGPNGENTEKVEAESSGCCSNSACSSSSSPSAAASSHSANGPTQTKEESNVNNNKNGVSTIDQSEEGSKSKAESGCGSSGDASMTSGGGSGMGERASKTKAVSDIAMANCPNDDSSDDDDDDDDVEEDMWEDMSDDDDEEDEDEDVDNDVPMMDMTNEEPGSDSGCTACVVLKERNKLYVANAGDSRCVLSRGGVAVEMSFDHKPEDDPERSRIEKAGGKVTTDGRVNGGLNLSRAFGDHVYKRNKDLPSKEQMISALPDVKTIELGSSDDFFVIACDGIWNFMSSQEVVDYIRERLSDSEKKKKPSLICEELFDHCLAPNILGDGTGCDNMTCILVVLDSGKTNQGTETSDKSDASQDKDDEQKDSLKRVVDNGEAEQAKKVKVGEDYG